MLCFVLKRLAWVFVLTYVFITITFIILQAMPGDASDVFLDPGIPHEVRSSVRERFGLDEPVHRQYFLYLRNFARGDLGYSFRHYPRSVWEIIVERLPRTFLLFFSATAAYYYIGFVLGKIIAWRRGTALEYAATFGGVLLYTVFLPIYALLLIWLLGLHLKWFPLGQFLSPSVWLESGISSSVIFNWIILSIFFIAAAFLLPRLLAPFFRGAVTASNISSCSAMAATAIILFVWQRSGYGFLARNIIWHMALPVFTLASASFAGSMLLMRDSMLETIKEDYVSAARARGLPESQVRDRHAARTALLPVVTSFSFAIASVMNGGIITETIFSWPGMGLTLIESIRTHDWPLALGAFAFTGIFVLLAHLAADILYAVLDPRIRYD